MEPIDNAAGKAGEPQPEEKEFPIVEYLTPIEDFRALEALESHPLIRNVEYHKDLIFRDRAYPTKGQTFPRGLSFVNVTFHKMVNFDKAVFEGPAYFWNCRFLGGASFFRMRVSDQGHAVHMRLAGEVNFSYCRFDSPGGEMPCFDRAQFTGPVFFHRTVFLDGVSMEETRFEGGVVLEGSQSDVCIAGDSLPKSFTADGLNLERLKKARILVTNTDHDDHFNFDWKIQTEEELKRRLLHLCDEANQTASARTDDEVLQQTLKNEAALAGVLALWRRGFDATMFSGRAGQAEVPVSSFRGTKFGPNSSCSRMSLGPCLFQGANLSDVKFLVVEWAEQPCGLVARRLYNAGHRLAESAFVRRIRKNAFIGKVTKSAFIRGTVDNSFVDFVFKNRPVRYCAHELRTHLRFVYRSALRDELLLDAEAKQGKPLIELRIRRKELSELYRGLRIAFDKDGDSHTSRDFYFGELEAERLSFGQIKQIFGISFAYKVFSGYSKREGLALSWLLAFIFILFPITFFIFVNRLEYKAISVRHNADWQTTLVQTAKGAVKVGPACQLPPAAGTIVVPADGNQPPVAASSPSASDLERYSDVMDRAQDAAWGNGKLPSRILRPVISSLEASTFLPPSGQSGTSVHTAILLLGSVKCDQPTREAPYTNAATALAGLEDHKRALEGVERLILPAQLGLFLLALKSRFQKVR